MNHKTKIRDCACSVVNWYKAVKFYKPDDEYDSGLYKIDDALHEWIKTEEAFEFIRDWIKHELSGDIKHQCKEQLFIHTKKELTKLVNDGYTLEIVD